MSDLLLVPRKLGLVGEQVLDPLQRRGLEAAPIEDQHLQRRVHLECSTASHRHEHR